MGLRTLQRMRRQADGWTLIELMVVLSLIVLLAGIALTNYRNAVIRAQEAVLKENLQRMRGAIDEYYADRGKYPASLEDLVTEGYLRRMPDDPFTNSSDTWETVMAEPDFTNPSADIGVYDVKSGSERSALDGTPYRDW